LLVLLHHTKYISTVPSAVIVVPDVQVRIQYLVCNSAFTSYLILIGTSPD
jgi:hypothetical protein